MILRSEHSQRELLGDTFQPSSIILFKGDLSKAFTLLSFSPDSVELTASELYQPTWDPLTPEQQRLYDSLLSIIPSDPLSLGDAPTQSWSMLYHRGSFGLRILATLRSWCGIQVPPLPPLRCYLGIHQGLR